MREISKEDLDVARRVKLRRSLLGISICALADRIGVTFQQIQKYEKGENRISSGTLMRISKALDTPASFFFGESGSTESVESAMLTVSSEARADMLRLIHAVMSIKDIESRRSLITIARALAKDGRDAERKAA